MLSRLAGVAQKPRKARGARDQSIAYRNCAKAADIGSHGAALANRRRLPTHVRFYGGSSTGQIPPRLVRVSFSGCGGQRRRFPALAFSRIHSAGTSGEGRPTMRLRDFKVLTFDCYGTLIDWESGIMAGLQPLVAKVGRKLGRDEILEAHAFHESSTQAQTPAKRYPEILAVVYKRLAEEWGVNVSWGECLAYGASVSAWPAFPDTAASLRYLKQHFRLVILSNVDNASFWASQQKLGVEFDAVYTAEDIGSYKPDDRNFEYMLKIGRAHV